ncbi:hypothetical protein BV22DRAFT_1192871 [Leucogyrophana mollusca]|uniref:Uncharacterized protein n=1 Tax=Leucogyrophana mollusca TaxID=85980 RepID=A0ACB8BTY4_9AGAM|nr:hypothetical protein BV22DRAFT_1192871 [Leucogyrophana mollusca]
MSTTSYTFQSPSVTLEKGAYRMRPPRAARTAAAPGPVRRSDMLAQGKKFTALIVLLTAATFISFATAYYLFSTRYYPSQKPVSTADHHPKVVAWPYTDHDHYEQSQYLAYLPHSGLHNQRIALENALTLAHILNRTLLLPPLRLATTPIRYLSFHPLRRALALSTKHGLFHCPTVPAHTLTPDECQDYFHWTQVPWHWLVDLDKHQGARVLHLPTVPSPAWLAVNLGIAPSATHTLFDTGPYHFRFHDSPFPSPNPKYIDSISIPDLALSPAPLLQLGTLFGSSRLHLKLPANKAIRRSIRRSMAFDNPDLNHAARVVHDLLGGTYLGAHLRLGDGRFRDGAAANARVVWWKLVHRILGIAIEDTMALERTLRVFHRGNDTEDDLDPPIIYPDLPSLRTPHPPLPPLPETFSLHIPCRGALHTNPTLGRLNVPLFISTDSADPERDPLLAAFLATFPCTFFLGDFDGRAGAALGVLRTLTNAYDSTPLFPFLRPLVDALVVAGAREVVGTEGSTFSTFVADVLWRVGKGSEWEIVERG